jgi:ferredoxin
MAFKVTLVRQKKDFAADPHMTILESAEAAGLRLPHSCREGMCSTCRSKLVSGQVDMRQNGGLRPAEVAAGMILLCCSRPLSDLEIER